MDLLWYQWLLIGLAIVLGVALTFLRIVYHPREAKTIETIGELDKQISKSPFTLVQLYHDL